MLAAGWDQVAFNAATSPAAAIAEEVAGGWLKELLGLPAGASRRFRHRRPGGQHRRPGRRPAPRAGRGRLGCRAGRPARRAAGPGGRRRRTARHHRPVAAAARLRQPGGRAGRRRRRTARSTSTTCAGCWRPGRPGPTLVCLQAGNVNTGACDDLRAAIDVVREHGGWVHVDGAFGLWAAASPSTRASGRRDRTGRFLGVRRPQVAERARTTPVSSSARTPPSTPPPRRTPRPTWSAPARCSHPSDFVLESSRRARGFAVWAALRELGGDGVAELVDRCCRLARRFAERLTAGGAEVVNDVVLNQVLVGFGSDARTDAVIDGSAAGRHLLARRHHLARSTADADRGVQLVDHRADDVDRSRATADPAESPADRQPVERP